MFKEKSKIITIILLVMTIILMVAIFYIGFKLTNSSEKTTIVVPQKIKAQDIPYSKTVELAKANPTNSPTPTLTPTPTGSSKIVTPTPSITEIVLKVASSSPTLSASVSAALAKAKSLPKTGFITNAIIMFVVAGSIIFLSFLF